MNAQPLNLDAIESLLAFWADAGVDACLDDAPTDRTRIIAPPVLRAVARATAAVVPATGIGDQVAEARRLASAANTMDELAEAISGFEGCALRGMGARQSVFARGNPAGGLLVIGEAPDAEDDARGQPFAGRTGQMLDRMLAAAGLTDQAFITNTVFWSPPGDRPPAPPEQAICAPFIERAMALIQPRAVLLLGAAAARSVLATDEGILKLRGQWRDWRLAEGGVSAPTLPTLHPAFLLRQPLAKRQVWADLLSLAARLDGADAPR
jgi:uracil-DNA glycosylase family 4